MAFAFILFALAADPTPAPLWLGEAPDSVGDLDVNQPTITSYLPPVTKAIGTGVIICPGGGYGFLAVDHEGKQVAQWLNERGVAAFVLNYRIVVKDKRPAPLHPAPLHDVQRAIRTVRSMAKSLRVQPDRIGVWGFSAGGHLASSAATHFDKGNASAADSIDRESCRPDFAILAYPVISMDPSVSHGGSRRNLLGDKPDPKLVELMSNEKQVTKETPPTFLFHTVEDKAVPIKNSILFKDACEKHGVPVELVTYARGQHGVGLALNQSGDVAQWTVKLEAWMKARGLLSRK